MKSPALLFSALCLGSLTSVLPAAEKPHVILIMVDDMGFSDLGYQGGEIDTPNLDALALGGVRFSQFYNSGRCCPTRATLMTGLHPHQTGIGHMTIAAGAKEKVGVPEAYQGHLNRQCVTVAETLQAAGYATMMTGKWHLGPVDQDDWPLQRGFEKYYGCIDGALRFFHPHGTRIITEGNEPVPEPKSTTEEAFYTTDAFTDHAIQFMKEEAAGANRPSFLYLAYNAPHWPLQAFEDDIAKYRGKYRIGWEKLRQQRYQRQIELGLIDPAWELSPATEGIPAWSTLNEKQQDEMDLKMAVYAAMVDRVDQNIGKLVTYLKESGRFENTLILFLSDNGACQEGGMLGRGEFYDVEKRNLEDANSYGEAWANAGSTPFRYYKHFAHEGGAATPFFMHWPATIAAQAGWYDSPAQLIDVLPTLADVAGAEYPAEFKGEAIHSLDGISLRPAFGAKPLNREEPIFIEHETNAFVREGEWKLVGKEVSVPGGTDASQWELYNMDVDRTELNDLAAELPEKVKELATKWEMWAERVKVYPRPGKEAAKATGEAEADPNPPMVKGRAFTVTAEVSGAKPHGVALGHGGVRFGYALHFVKGRPAFVIRDQGKLTQLMAKEAVRGKVKVEANLDGEAMVLRVDGREVARKKSPGLLSEQPGLGLYRGLDGVDPVGDYKVPNALNVKLLKAEVTVTMPKVAMRTRWAANVTAETAWQQYPRPAFEREQWLNLNGHWDYALTEKSLAEPPEKWDGKILVPFAFESPLSGVERRVTPEDAIWYRRSFELAAAEGKRTLLNFEAVDYECTVWLNGKKVGEHTGGNLPFHFDVTEAALEGRNEVMLRVTDATDTTDAFQLHGKQRLNPKGIWYTPVSGIWQTVWVEQVPPAHLESVKITTKIDGTVRMIFGRSEGAKGEGVNVRISLGDQWIAEGRGMDEAVMVVPEPQLWSPDSPMLYEVVLTTGEDVVKTYVGIRETGIIKDDEGHLRFTLNGAPIFHWGTLDQGWWPDGLLTPPSEEAMLSDIQFLKYAGFNMIRKHIKVEPRRYYYDCDRLGMMMWQDQVSNKGPSDPEWTRLQPNPQDVVWPEGAHAQYMTELKQMIDGLHNHPCIVQWVPFNERWGQHQEMEVGQWIMAYDPTRPINISSGGNWYPTGHIVDEHRYPDPGFPFELREGGRFDGFVKVVGELGGHGFPVEGHVWDPTTHN